MPPIRRKNPPVEVPASAGVQTPTPNPSEATIAVGTALEPPRLPQSSILLRRRQDSRRAAILYQLWREGPISRGHLAEQMGLNLPMVSSCVQDLIKDGELIEEGYATSTGGRKAQLLDVNPKRGGVVAIEFSRRGILSASADMKGRLYNHVIRPFDFRQGVKAAIAAIFEAVDMQSIFLKEDEGLSLERIGIVTSGLVDEENGISISFPAFAEWDNIPIAQMLSDHHEKPVNLANHVVATTLAETVCGRNRAVPNMLYVHIGPGIGMGIVVDHAVYRGTRAAVGELGHVALGTGGAECYSGVRGALETVASEAALVAEAERRIAAGEATQIPHHVDDTGRISAATIFRAADMDDAVAKDIIDRAGVAIGTALAAAVNLLAPNAILFGGSMVEDGERLLRRIRETVGDRALPALTRGLAYELGTFGAQAGVTGAVCLALHSHYNSFAD
jgi:predicted NBD/HSP70 family sugar kinase